MFFRNRPSEAGTKRPASTFGRIAQRVRDTAMTILLACGVGAGMGTVSGCKDGGGSSGPTNPNNTPTVTSPVTLAMAEDTPTTVTVASLKSHLTDADNDALVLVSVSPKTVHGGTVTLSSDGTIITIATPKDFYGADAATAIFTDNHGGNVTLPIDILVQNNPDIPSGPDLTLDPVAESATDAPTTYILTQDVILGGVTSPDGGVLHIHEVHDPLNGGKTTANPDGSFTVTMPAYWDGTTSVFADIYETIPAPAALGANEVIPSGLRLAWLPKKAGSEMMSDASSVFAVATNDTTFANQPIFSRRINFTITHSNHSPTGDNATVPLDPALFTLPKTINARTILKVADPDTARHSDTVSLSILQQDPNGLGTATLDGDNLTFTPAPGKSGDASVVVRLTDSVTPNPGTRDVTLTLTGEDTLAPAIDVPTYDISALTKSDVVATVIVSKNVPAPVGWSAATPVGNKFAYTHTFTANGSFAFTTKDAAGADITVTATVANINRVAPTASAPVNIANADGTVTSVFTISTELAAKLPLTLSPASVAAGWNTSAPSPTGTVLTVAKTFHDNTAPAGEIVNFTDNLGLPGSATVIVNNTNHAPTGNNASVTLPAVTTANPFTAAATFNWKTLTAAADQENDTITATIQTQGTLGTAVITGDNVTWTPTKNKQGTESIVIRLSDSKGLFKDVTVTLGPVDTITPVLSAPAYSTSAPTNGPVTVTISSNKSFTAPAGWTGPVASGNQFNYTQTFNANTSGTFTTVDAQGQNVTQTYTIGNIDTVAPTASGTTAFTNNPDGSTTATLHIVDNNSGALSVVGSANWVGASPVLTAGNYDTTFTKIYSADTTETVTFRDPAGNTVPVTVSALIALSTTATDFAGLTLKGATSNDSVTFNKPVTIASARIVDMATNLTATTGSITATVNGTNNKKVDLHIVAPGTLGVGNDIFVQVEIVTAAGQTFRSATYRLTN